MSGPSSLTMLAMLMLRLPNQIAPQCAPGKVPVTPRTAESVPYLKYPRLPGANRGHDLRGKLRRKSTALRSLVAHHVTLGPGLCTQRWRKQPNSLIAPATTGSAGRPRKGVGLFALKQ